MSTSRKIRKRIIQCLDIKSLLNLARMKQAVRKLVYTHEWNINDKLRRFVKNPIAFRRHQSQTRAIISGSFALQFFERVTWPDSDLDVFIDESKSGAYACMLEYLISSEGYTLAEDGTDEDQFYTKMSGGRTSQTFDKWFEAC